MKNIKYLFSLLCLALIIFACNEKYDRSPGGIVTPRAPELSAPGQSNVQILTPDAETQNPFLVRLNWSRARFSYDNGLPADVSNVKYTLEIDMLGDLFAHPTTVITTDLLFTDLFSTQLTNLVKGLLAVTEINDVQYVEFRIKTTYQENGTDADPIYSNSVTLTVTPYVEPGIPDVPEVTIHWKQVTGDWSEFAVYSWGGSPNYEAFGGWPGTVVAPDADGWYSVVVPGKRPINMILNNNGGGKQFDFLSDPTEEGYYEVNTADGTFTKVDNPAKEITIRWKYTGSDWTAFGIYAWGGNPVGETFGGWPGTVVTPDTDGWCSVTVPAGQTVGNVIFNNTNGGAGNQFDVNLKITSSICFEITSSAYTVVDCQ